MPRCDHCAIEIRRKPITREGDPRAFCSHDCREFRQRLPELNELPTDFVEEKVMQRHLGDCPKCHRPGPIDVHQTHRVYSFLIFTSFGSRFEVGCARCGRLQRLQDTGLCLLLGWWGIPWGLFGTPIQVLRNLWNVGAPVRTNQPSQAFRIWAVDELAVRVLHERQQEVHRRAAERDSAQE